MQITINFTDEDVALLEKGLALENQQRQEVANDLEARGYVETTKLYRGDYTLTEYAHATLIYAIRKIVERQELINAKQGGVQ